MGSTIMGVVGVQRMSRRKAGNARSARASGHDGSAETRSDVSGGGTAVISEQEQLYDPEGEWMKHVPSRHHADRVRFRYHNQAGTEGEAVGYRTGSGAIFLVTPPLLPLGSSLILEEAEAGKAPGSRTVAGKVTAVFPVSDEFGFPPGIGVSVTPEETCCPA